MARAGEPVLGWSGCLHLETGLRSGLALPWGAALDSPVLGSGGKGEELPVVF